MKKPGFWGNLLAAAVILGLLAFLLTRSRMVDIDEHYRYLGTIGTLQELDVAVNGILLRSRHAYLANYDPLVAAGGALRNTAADLERFPGFVAAADRKRLQPLVAEYLALLEKQEELHERFKSENAILHNSLSFFPIAASEMAEAVMAENPELAAALQELLRDIFMYNLYSYPEILHRLEGRLAAFRAGMERHGRTADPAALERNLRHAEVILRHKQQLDQITLDSLNLPARQAIQAIYREYQQAYLRAMRTASNHRLALYLAAIFLAAGIAYSMVRWHNASVALRLANEDLEAKVRERTEELRRNNLSLQEQQKQLGRSLAELQAAQEELRNQAMTDELTGLYARRFLFEWLEKRLAGVRRQNGVLSCLLLDADHFKQVNDTFGHAAGDRVLRDIAAIIHRCLRQADIAGRFGGEEFLVLLPDTSREQALIVAEKIRMAVAETAHWPLEVTVSIGVAACDCRQQEATECATAADLIERLLQRADQALYQAKDRGRNRVVVEPVAPSP